MMGTVAFSAINADDKIRNMSSSGAVFYELAKWTILNKGVVYGAKFDENWKIVHGHTEKMDRIQDFLGSKYVQSDMQNEYKDAEKDLKGGRLVLFSGTPCQISGLNSFLRKDYENLIMVDFICHGIPSPSVWKSYIDRRAQSRHIESINFRDKTEGWENPSLKIKFLDGSSYRKSEQKDLYMKGFLQNIYLRPSCYECQFKGIDRVADITLADFWGIKKVKPEMFDKKGTSLILIHSKKGMNLWNKVQGSFKFCEVEVEEALSYNTAATVSAEHTTKRENFYLSRNNQFSTLEKITRKPLRRRIISKSKRIFKKLVGRK